MLLDDMKSRRSEVIVRGFIGSSGVSENMSFVRGSYRREAGSNFSSISVSVSNSKSSGSKRKEDETRHLSKVERGGRSSAGSE